MADTILTENEIDAALRGLSGWTRMGTRTLRKQFALGGFKAALAFVNTVGELAERADHHPNILIEYSTVTVMLSTHDTNGVTARDVRLARQIEAASQ